MALDIKKEVDKLVDKIRQNPQLMKEFTEDPIPVVEQLIGIDLPDAEIKKAAELIKAKIDLDKAGDLLKGLGGLFK